MTSGEILGSLKFFERVSSTFNAGNGAANSELRA